MPRKLNSQLAKILEQLEQFAARREKERQRKRRYREMKKGQASQSRSAYARDKGEKHEQDQQPRPSPAAKNTGQLEKLQRKQRSRPSPYPNAQLSFLLPLNNSNSSPLKEGSEGRSSSREVLSRGHALPQDWMPTVDDYQYGIQLGLRPDEITGAAEDMRLWAGANRNRAVARKADWNLTFKGWLRREVGKRSSKNGSRGTTWDVLRDLDRAIKEGPDDTEPLGWAAEIRRG